MAETDRASELRAKLTPAQQALLEKRLRAALSPDTESQVIPNRTDQSSFPLSFAQERMWFLDQWQPGNPAYNRPVVLRLTGRLDRPVLERTLSEIVRRHEILRATFSDLAGQPVQTISPPEPVRLPVLDLSSLPQSKREPEARRLVTEEAERPIDLDQGPLFRARLLQLDVPDHVLTVVAHHIAFDAWSASVFLRELAAIYTAFSAGQPSPLPDPPVQYADFAAWQRDWLQGEALETELGYWKRQLQDAPTTLELPADRPRPPVQSYRGGSEAVVLPKGLTKELTALSQNADVTLFMTLLSAFKILLHRLTGQEDLVVGTPTAGRNQPETEGLIGMFLNNLILRTDLSGNPTFLDLLGRVRDTALGAYDHRDLPFEKLLEELQPERDPSRTPLFQFYFNMILLDDLDTAPPALSIEEVELHGSQANFDLTVYVRQVDEGIEVRFTHDADLFDQARVAEMLAQFRQLLGEIVTSPEKPIRSYSLVTSDARALLPDPRSSLSEPPQEPVTRMFASWAERALDSPAVSQGTRTWTYGELSRHAHALARALSSSGLVPGDVVAVLGPQSFGLIASMVGTLLSGCVLMPIDGSLPRQRQDLMLCEADARAIVYVGSAHSRDEWLAGREGLDVLRVDKDTGRVFDSDLSRERETRALPEVKPDDPAYIFFTSGTTGVPRGVLGCHKGLSHFLAWQRDTFAVGPTDRVSQLIGLSFDASLRDILLPLVSGAMLCLPEETDTLDPEDLLRWLAQERITIMHTVPSLAQFWLTHAAVDVCLRTMRWVFFAGEPLTEALVRKWRTIFPGGGEIINLYGPTETTLVKCFWQVAADPFPGVQPAGWPMPQTQALVLTESNQLCGIGELGEIVLRSPFRTLGYINDSPEDRKGFSPNPFRGDGGDLLYYTGDRGRYRPDGMLEILGRLDDQVKIRGVRVEPGEATATLARHPAVKACVVVPRLNEQEEYYLAAYVVASREDAVSAGQLRTFLNQQLPAALVPRVFMFLDQLPLTPNGKVDRSALPVPSWPAQEEPVDFVSPRTEVERTLAGIWTDVLAVQQVGIHDSFFELGGHSLLATKLISRVRDTFRVQLHLRTLFEAPTISDLAKSIETLRWATQGVQEPIYSAEVEREEGQL